MSLYIESIRIKNGKAENLELHQERVNNTLGQKSGEGLNLKNHLEDLKLTNSGLFKWRIEYNREKIHQNQLIPYHPTTVSKIKLVEAPNLKYALKYSNREIFKRLLLQSKADDIIITQKGVITEASYANVFFWNGVQWETPSTPLLNGTQRRLILNRKLAVEKKIHLNDIKQYFHFKRVNAMMNWEDSHIEKIDIIIC